MKSCTNRNAFRSTAERKNVSFDEVVIFVPEEYCVARANESCEKFGAD